MNPILQKAITAEIRCLKIRIEEHNEHINRRNRDIKGLISSIENDQSNLKAYKEYKQVAIREREQCKIDIAILKGTS